MIDSVGSKKAVMAPSPLGKALFLRRKLSLSFRARLAYVTFRVRGAGVQDVDSLFFVEVISQACLRCLCPSFTRGTLRFTRVSLIQNARSIVRESSLGSGGFDRFMALLVNGLTRNDLELLYWLEHRCLLPAPCCQARYSDSTVFRGAS